MGQIRSKAADMRVERKTAPLYTMVKDTMSACTPTRQAATRRPTTTFFPKSLTTYPSLKLYASDQSC